MVIVKFMVNIFERLKSAFKGPFAANMPRALAQCEYACRIRHMREEIAPSHAESEADSAAK